jgi:hypothetical protein
MPTQEKVVSEGLQKINISVLISHTSYNKTMRSTTLHFSSKRLVCRFSTNVYIISKSSTFKRRHNESPN